MCCKRTSSFKNSRVRPSQGEPNLVLRKVTLGFLRNLTFSSSYLYFVNLVRGVL